MRYFLIVLFFSHTLNSSYATYSAAYIYRNTITFGADDRSEYRGDYTDNICKIIFLNRNIIFSLLGSESYRLGNGSQIHLPALVQSIKFNTETLTSLLAVISTVASTVQAALNEGGAGADVATILIVAGVDNEGPGIFKISINFDTASKRYIVSHIDAERQANKLIPTSIPNYTTWFLKTQSFSAFAQSRSALPMPRQYAALLQYVITNMGSFIHVKNIGKIARIVTLEKDKKPVWYTPNAPCEDPK